MSVFCFTSFSYSYLSRARVLAASLRRAHPDWKLFALIVDEPPPNADPSLLEASFDGVIQPHELGIPRLRSWLFKHDIVEACTAVKGHGLLRLLDMHDKVIYFDPDIALFHPLDDIEALLDTASVILTPHQVTPNQAEEAVRDNELTSMRYGIFNLGFLAVRRDEAGLRFARWWATQLYRACYDEVENGIFTDQKYCDLVPALFDRVHVQRDPGYNVASWNISRRTLRMTRAGGIEANGAPLRFYHFTKIGSVGDTMTERYALDSLAVPEIWEWYRRELTAHAVDWVPPRYWAYARFSDGTLIPKSARVLYRRRADLMTAFADPFQAGRDGYLQWLRDQEPELLRAA